MKTRAALLNAVFYVHRASADALMNRLLNMDIERHVRRLIAQFDRPLHRSGDGLVIERVIIFMGHGTYS